MSRPISLFLTDFSRPAPPLALPLPSEPIVFEDAEPKGPAFESRIEQARQEAFADGEAAGRAALEANVAELEEEHRQALEAARESWSVQEGAALADLLREGLSALETRLAEALADAVQPILKEAVRAKALDDLRDALATLLGSGDCRSIRVSGPADLVDALKESSGSSPILAFEATEEDELTIAAGDTTIRSSLQAWSRQVQDQIRNEG